MKPWRWGFWGWAALATAVLILWAVAQGYVLADWSYAP